MVDAWVYVDESQAPHAGGTDPTQPFWLAALITETPIEGTLVEQALARLQADPDAVGNAQDQATLTRRYFHASLDSKNAHSWICRGIVGASMDASFSATQWHFDRHDGGKYAGAPLHRLAAVLSVLTGFQDQYDTVHVHLAEREGSFQQNHADEWPDYCRKMNLGGLISMPGLPVRFPRIDATLVDGSDPGVQVCDFILWAVQRSRPDGVTPAGDMTWLHRLGVKLTAAGGVKGSAYQALDGELGSGAQRPLLPPSDSAPAPREMAALSDADRWQLLQEIARDIHETRAIVLGNPTVGHLTSEVSTAAAALEIAHLVPENLPGLIGGIMESFLLICDTLPVYDPGDSAAWSRAVEKRKLAADFLKGGKVWVPDGFSLRNGEV